jgi:hypothetical protein
VCRCELTTALSRNDELEEMRQVQPLWQVGRAVRASASWARNGELLRLAERKSDGTKWQQRADGSSSARDGSNLPLLGLYPRNRLLGEGGEADARCTNWSRTCDQAWRASWEWEVGRKRTALVHCSLPGTRLGGNAMRCKQLRGWPASTARQLSQCANPRDE